MGLPDEVPEAQQFYESVADSMPTLKLFETEEFDRVLNVVLATSGPDSHGEAFSPEALERMVEEINEKGLAMWAGAHHDPLIQTCGRIVAARVFYAPASDMHFVAAVVGMYDPKKINSFKEMGVDVPALSDALTIESPKDDVEQVQLSFNPVEVDPKVVDELLADAPESVAKEPIRAVRKAAEPVTILGICASIPFLAFLTSLGKSFGKRFGENAADAFSTWLAKVFDRIAALARERVLFVFDSPYRGCDVQFVIDSTDAAVLREASQTIDAAARSAVSLIDQLHDHELVKLVYAFDRSTRTWLPVHATSKKSGVICDRPYLIATEKLMGLSVGGIAPDDEAEDS